MTGIALTLVLLSSYNVHTIGLCPSRSTVVTTKRVPSAIFSTVFPGVSIKPWRSTRTGLPTGPVSLSSSLSDSMAQRSIAPIHGIVLHTLTQYHSVESHLPSGHNPPSPPLSQPFPGGTPPPAALLLKTFLLKGGVVIESWRGIL